jgi:hypothetical protein
MSHGGEDQVAVYVHIGYLAPSFMSAVLIGAVRSLGIAFGIGCVFWMPRW